MTEVTPAHAAPDDASAPVKTSAKASDQNLDEVPEVDPDAQVRVSLLSALPGHRFNVPSADGQSTLTIDSVGVLVDQDAVEAIQTAARNSGVIVKAEVQ